MNLRVFLREEWSKYVRPLIVKDKCEFCGSEEDLHLHHIDRFHNLLIETLEELDLEELDTDKYSTLELQNISNIMLGKQLKCGYKTLCKNCHLKLHAKENKEEIYKTYNPYGSYLFLNIDKFKENNIEPSIFIKIIKLSTFMNYDNQLKIKKKSYGLKDIQDLLNMKERNFHRFKTYILKNKLIIIDENKNIFINKDYIKKGYTNYKNKMIVFIDNFNKLYDKLEDRKHKILGNIIYFNKEQNQIYPIEYINYSNIHRTIQELKKHDILKYKNKSIMFNPSIFCFDFISNIKILEDTYFNFN